MKWKSWGLALYQYVTTPINIKYKWAWGVQSNNNLTTIYKPLHVNVIRNCNVITVVSVNNLGHVRLGSIRNKNNWNNVSKRLFGSYSHSGIPGFPFRLFYSQEQNSRNIFRNIFRNKFLFRNIPNERALKLRQWNRKNITWGNNIWNPRQF